MQRTPGAKLKKKKLQLVRAALQTFFFLQETVVKISLSGTDERNCWTHLEVTGEWEACMA